MATARTLKRGTGPWSGRWSSGERPGKATGLHGRLAIVVRDICSTFVGQLMGSKTYRCHPETLQAGVGISHVLTTKEYA
jgi:hypothetical protein